MPKPIKDLARHQIVKAMRPAPFSQSLDTGSHSSVERQSGGLVRDSRSSVRIRVSAPPDNVKGGS